MVGIRYVIFLLLVHKTFASGNEEVPSPENVVVVPLKSYLCENFESTSLLNISIHKVGGDGKNRVADGQLVLDEEFTEFWMSKIIIEKWENDAWKEVHKLKGRICELMDRYAKDAWKKSRSETSPALPDGCSIEAGQYTFTDLVVSRDEYNFPVTATGMYKTTFRISNEIEDEVMCIILELEVVKKS